MANLVQSLLQESAQTAFENQNGVATKLVKKWAKSGLLEGLADYERNNMAIILENQSKQLVVETNQTNQGGSTWNTGNGTGEQWAGVALPMVRKIMGQIAAKEFVSVQPMNLPAGLVFYLDFQYGNTKNPFRDGDSIYGTPSANFGNLAEGGLYGGGKFGYSLNQFSASAVTAVAETASWSEVQYEPTLSASVAAGRIKKLAVTVTSLSGSDTDAARSFIIFSGSVAPTDVFQNYTTVGGGNFNFFVTASTAEIPTLTAFTVLYSKATDFNARGDFEDRSGNPSVPNSLSNTSIVIPEINVQMKNQTISAKTRKLKAQWTPEFAQDLNAYHALDAEAELTSILSEYISLEIDLEILDMLMENASAGTEVWSAVNNRAITGTGNGTISDLGFYNSQGQWFQTLGTKIQKLSNIIHQRTLRGGANFMVLSPAVSTIIESIPGFAGDVDGQVDKMNYAFGVQKVGALGGGKIKVYKNPYMTENQILLGFRGTQFLESGAVFAPYIPLIMTPLVYDPDTFTPRKGLLTRYAKKMVRPEFYGKIQINGLNTL